MLLPNSANCQPTSKATSTNGQSTLNVPSDEYFKVRDAAFRSKDLAQDVLYWADRAQKAESEVANLKARINEKDIRLGAYAENQSLLEDNILTLNKRTKRLSKPERLVIGPGYGVGIGGGMIHHMAGLHVTLRVFGGLRL